jgi:hypothetical protein
VNKVDPIIGGSLPMQYSPQQRLLPSADGSSLPELQDGFARGSKNESTFAQADALKRMAAQNGKNEVKRVEGFSPRGVEEFSDLALNGLGSKEIIYLGV